MCCSENYQKMLDENLKKRFVNTYKFSNHDINKFILLLGKGVDPYEYMIQWKKFNKMSLPEKEDFYWYMLHARKDFEIKNLSWYWDLYVQSDTLLLDDVFINLQNSVLKYMGLILFIFLSKPGLARQADLKKTKVK